MTTSRVKTILAAIDYSDTSSLVVERAIEMACQKQPVELHFLHVNHAAPENDDEQEALQAELLEWLGARLRNDDGMPYAAKVVSHEASGDPGRVIIDMAGDLLADLVIVGTHDRKGMERLVVGSVSESVLRNCSCAVLVVRATAHSQPFPKLDPACPRCVETRAATSGSQFWCEQHREKHGRRHTYYNTRQSSWVSQRMMP